MFCNKCGKQIEKGTLCNECLVAELVSEEPAKVEAVVQESEKVVPAQESVATDAGIDAAGNFTFFNEQSSASVNTPEHADTSIKSSWIMYGFGRALASTIMSVIGYFFVYIGLYACIEVPEAGLVFSIFALPLIIVPLILGILSIKAFKSRRYAYAKPIPTLVLGIVGTSISGLMAFANLCLFIASIGMIA